MLDDDGIKRFGELQRESFICARDGLVEEHSASFRWLMASLLALNSGALVGLNGLIQQGNHWSIAGGVAFYFGIASALLVAWFGQRANRLMLAPVSELIGFWGMVAVTGDVDPVSHSELSARLDAAGKNRKASISGFVSFAAFSAGLGCLIVPRLL